MPKVKIIQVFNAIDDEYYATQRDVAEITDWEEIPDVDMYHLKEALRRRNLNSHGSHRDSTPYALMILPDDPVSAVESVRQVIEQYRKDEEKEAVKRKVATEKYQATKLERKRKQFEKLKKELGDQ